jgi:hypothetical protein
MNIGKFYIEYEGLNLVVEAEWEEISKYNFHVFITAFAAKDSDTFMPAYWLNELNADMISSKVHEQLENRSV